MDEQGIVVHKAWRAELPRLIVFAVFCILSIVLSRMLPQSIIRGELISIAGRRIYLSLPLFWFMPLTGVLNLLYRVYNARYLIGKRFIESRIGVLSLNQVAMRVRYEDVRGVETDQNLMGRFLDYGNVQIGTAASAGMEVIMYGVSAPKEIQDMILRERDRRLERESTTRMRPKEDRASA